MLSFRQLQYFFIFHIFIDMTPISFLFFIFGIIFVPLSAQAFNSLLLFDHDFQIFILVYVPLVFSLLISCCEIFLVKKFIGSEFNLKNIFLKIFRANIFTFVINYLILIIVTVLTWKATHDIENPEKLAHPLIIWTAVIYFGATFIYIAWNTKYKKLLKIMGENAKNRKFRIAFFLNNLAAYGILYAFLYFYLI